MTMISFRVDEADAAEIEAWARRLGIDRSELVRDALRRHLAELAVVPSPAAPSLPHIAGKHGMLNGGDATIAQ